MSTATLLSTPLPDLRMNPNHHIGIVQEWSDGTARVRIDRVEGPLFVVARRNGTMRSQRVQLAPGDRVRVELVLGGDGMRTEGARLIARIATGRTTESRRCNNFDERKK
jgi:translation initiation factor IF-1